MKFVVYHSNPKGLARFARHLVNQGHTVPFKISSRTLLFRLAAFCEPKFLLVECAEDGAANPQEESGAKTLPLQALVWHPDPRSQRILAGQLEAMGYPIAAVLASLDDLRQWCAEHEPQLVCFEAPEDIIPVVVTPQSNRPSSLTDLMRASGFTLNRSERQWEEAVVANVESSARGGCPGKHLQSARVFFRTHGGLVPEGLETLPDCWLAQLPGLLIRLADPRWPRLCPLGVLAIHQNQGVLNVRFAQENDLPNQEGMDSVWNGMRVFLNLNLYPNRWGTNTQAAA